MTSRFPLRAVLAGAALVLSATAFADGVPVMPWYAGLQTRPGLAPDGAGGAWLAFKSDSGRTGIVRLAGNGLANPSWPNGIFYTGLTTQTTSPARVFASSPDRVYVVSDYCAYDGLVMGYDSAGDTATGFPVSATLFYPGPTSVLGASGDILSAVGGSLSVGGYGVRFAIVSALGELLMEQEYDVNMQVPAGEPYTAITDGAGGAIVALAVFATMDYTSGYDVGLTRIAADGTRPWGNTAKVVCSVNTDQRLIRIWPDGAGGALLTWNDSRTGAGITPLEIYGARYTSAGTLAAGWTGGGKRITTATGSQFESRVVDDGANGMWVLWRDQRVADIDLYFTHMLANGTYAAGFSGLGALLCGATGAASDPQMVPDGAGGFFAVWVDARNGNSDLYGTHITSAGAPAPGWPANGLALCDDVSFQTLPALVATGVGTAIVAWRDSRGTNGNVYALGLGSDGPSTTGVTPMRVGALRLRAAANPAIGLPELRISAPAGGPVDIELVDVTGRVVRRTSLLAGGGETTARFTGGPLAAGVYFATARRGPERATLRLTVLR